MEKIKIAITGLHGVLGSKLLQALPPDLKDNCVIYDLYHTTKKTSYLNGLPIRHTKLDLMNAESIVSTLRKIRPEVIIHLAAITHIDRCELEANNKNNSKSWLINVEATKKIVSFCKKGNTHLVFLSTECIFDGESDSFAENSKPNPKNWYGITKASAEAAVKNSKNPWTIIRAVIAYDTSIQSKTIFSAIKNAFEKNKEFFAVSDQKFTPSYIPDIHRAIWNVVLYKHLGLIHISPQKSITPYQFAIAIGTHYGYDLSLVKKQKMDSYFGIERAQLRLKNACLSMSDSIKVLNFVPKTIQQVLKS